MRIISHRYSHAEHFNLLQVWKKLINWCERQQDNRLGWLGASLMLHGCVFAPMTIGFVSMSNHNFGLLAIAIAGMIASLSVNLAAQPTKITLPVFFASILIDVFVVIICIAEGVHFSHMLR